MVSNHFFSYGIPILTLYLQSNKQPSFVPTKEAKVPGTTRPRREPVAMPSWSSAKLAPTGATVGLRQSSTIQESTATGSRVILTVPNPDKPLRSEAANALISKAEIP